MSIEQAIADAVMASTEVACIPAVTKVSKTSTRLVEKRGSLDDNNNNSHGNVYGAVIMTKVIARVHPVHLMNVD